MSQQKATFKELKQALSREYSGIRLKTRKTGGNTLQVTIKNKRREILSRIARENGTKLMSYNNGIAVFQARNMPAKHNMNQLGEEIKNHLQCAISYADVNATLDGRHIVFKGDGEYHHFLSCARWFAGIELPPSERKYGALEAGDLSLDHAERLEEVFRQFAALEGQVSNVPTQNVSAEQAWLARKLKAFACVKHMKIQNIKKGVFIYCGADTPKEREYVELILKRMGYSFEHTRPRSGEIRGLNVYPQSTLKTSTDRETESVTPEKTENVEKVAAQPTHRDADTTVQAIITMIQGLSEPMKEQIISSLADPKKVIVSFLRYAKREHDVALFDIKHPVILKSNGDGYEYTGNSVGKENCDLMIEEWQE